MDKNIKSITEGHAMLLKNQKEIKSELQTVKMAVMGNSREIKTLKAGQQELKTSHKDMEARLGRIEAKLDVITEDHERRLQKLEAVR